LTQLRNCHSGTVLTQLPLALLLLAARPAAANPLDLARFDGIYGDALAEGAFALYWNPAALARPGWSAQLDLQLVARQASYDRDAQSNAVPPAEQAANAGLATISTEGVVPNLAGRWGRSVGPVDLGVGLGAFVETGGAASWDKNLRAPSSYPGAVDGPQRWASIDARLIVADLGLGLALRHRASGFAVGVTPIVAIASFSTLRARNIDQSEDLVDAAGKPKEGRALFDGSGAAFGCVVGARWEATPWLTLGAAWQHGARFTLTGPIQIAFGTQPPSSQTGVLELPVADSARFALGLRLGRGFTLRPSFEWARWSILEQHVFAATDGTPLLVIPRNYADDVAVRVRGDLRIGARFSVSAGLGFERGPTPSSTMEPGFGEGDSVEAAAGARVRLTHRVDLAASFFFVYYPPWTVAGSAQRPTTNGTYTDQRELLLVDLEVHEWR
jgi:long-subunit fatty acid transport protein